MYISSVKLEHFSPSTEEEEVSRCQKERRSREKLFKLDVSVLYCHPAAIFAVVVTTNDSLNSLHGPQTLTLQPLPPFGVATLLTTAHPDVQ